MTLDQVLHTELHKMLCRNLDFAPQPEDLPATHAVMLEDSKRRGLTDDDADRVQRAFWRMGPTIQRFPTPKMLFEALPSRQSFHQTIEHQSGDRRAAEAAFCEMRRMLGMLPLEPGRPAFGKQADEEDEKP